MALSRANANFVNQYFIPEQFSKTVLTRYYAQGLLPNITNSTYQGELSGKGKGDTVHIRREPTIVVQDHEVGGDLNFTMVQDEEIQLTLDYNKVSSYMVANEDMDHLFDIDVQKMLLDAFAKKHEEVVTETILGSVYSSATSSLAGAAWQTSTNSTAHVALAGATLDTLKIPRDKRALVVHPMALQWLSQQQANWANSAGTSTGAQITGLVGMYAGFKVFSSPLVPGAGTSGNPYKCIALHEDAIAMAALFKNVKVSDYPQKLSQLIIGQTIFGFKVVQPDALVYLPVQVS